MSRETVNSLRPLGSLVFETAIVALELPEHMSRALMSERLAVLGMKPADLTIELLGTLMPQIDESLRLCLPQSDSRSAMMRLTAFVIDWEEVPVHEPKPKVEAPSEDASNLDFDAE
tara:strand:+ start:38910 stop:39257 length:348 start_codon:yes stop_codon:yes gene_type:complete